MVTQVEVIGAAMVVRLARPEVRNALTAQAIGELREAFAAAEDPMVAGVVVTGQDPAFCAGLDLRELEEDASRFVGHDLPGWIRALDKPVVAAVNGPAMTGGLELALACDLRFASPHARFADTHLSVGVVPGWGMTVRLPELVGISRAMDLSLSGRMVGAEEAASIGLVDRVIEHDRLLDTAVELVASVAAADPEVRRTVLGLYRDQSTRATREAVLAEQGACTTWFERVGTVDHARVERLLVRGRTD